MRARRESARVRCARARIDAQCEPRVQRAWRRVRASRATRAHSAAQGKVHGPIWRMHTDDSHASSWQEAMRRSQGSRRQRGCLPETLLDFDASRRATRTLRQLRQLRQLRRRTSAHEGSAASGSAPLRDRASMAMLPPGAPQAHHGRVAAPSDDSATLPRRHRRRFVMSSSAFPTAPLVQASNKQRSNKQQLYATPAKIRLRTKVNLIKASQVV